MIATQDRPDREAALAQQAALIRTLRGQLAAFPDVPRPVPVVTPVVATRRRSSATPTRRPLVPRPPPRPWRPRRRRPRPPRRPGRRPIACRHRPAVVGSARPVAARHDARARPRSAGRPAGRRLGAGGRDQRLDRLGRRAPAAADPLIEACAASEANPSIRRSARGSRRGCHTAGYDRRAGAPFRCGVDEVDPPVSAVDRPPGRGRSARCLDLQPPDVGEVDLGDASEVAADNTASDRRDRPRRQPRAVARRRMPDVSRSRTARARWPRYGSSSSSIRSSVARGSPASAHATRCGRWKSPTLTASESPRARTVTSAAVHGPMPGIASRRAVSAAGPSSAAASSAAASAADPPDHLGPPPLHAQRMEREVGHRRQRRGRRRQRACRPRPPDPGAGSPYRIASARHAPMRLDAGDLLLEDRRDQRLHHRPARRNPQSRPQAVEPVEQAVGSGAPARARTRPGRPRGPTMAGARRSTSSAPGPHASTSIVAPRGRDPHRRRPVGRSGRAPDLAAHPHRRVAGPAPERREAEAQVDRGRGIHDTDWHAAR